MTERVLIVDDERSLCETLHAGLSRRGFAVAWRSMRGAAPPWAG